MYPAIAAARRLWGPRREVSQRRLGSALAGWPGNAVLHAFSRSPPSRAGVYARASARIPVAERGGVRDLELGKAVERVRVAWRPRLRFLRNRSRAQAARGWDARVETSSPSRWGCCRSSGRRQRSEAGARISRVGGRCRNVARAITTHRFGLWAVDRQLGSNSTWPVMSANRTSGTVKLRRYGVLSHNGTSRDESSRIPLFGGRVVPTGAHDLEFNKGPRRRSPLHCCSGRLHVASTVGEFASTCAVC